MVLNIGGRGIVIVLGLITLPVLVHRLGGPAFGVYVLAVSLGGVLGLLDLGLTPALVTLLSRSYHRQAPDEMRSLLTTACTLYVAVGVAGGCILAFLVPWAVNGLLHVPPELQGSARVSLWLSVAGFVLNMWLSVFNAVPVALERYDLVAARMVGLGVCTTLALISYAMVGGNLTGLVLINVLGSAAGLGAFYLVSRSLLPDLRVRPGFDPTSFRELARFSAFKFAGTLGGFFTFRFDLFAIGSLLGVSAVALYAIPANASFRVSSLIGELVVPLFPRASKLRGDPGAIQRLFLRSSRGMALIATPVLMTLFIFADLVLLYWIGGSQGQTISSAGTAAMRWLLAGLFIQALAAVPSIFCEALGKPEINNGFAVASALLHVPLIFILVPRYGITGAGIALFINSALQTVTFILFASGRLAKLEPSHLFRAALLRPIVAAGMVLPIGYAARQLAIGPALVGAFLVLLPASYFGAALLISAIAPEDFNSLRIGLGRLGIRSAP